MRRVIAADVLIASLAAPIAAGAQALVEQKMQGTVLSTRVTVCQLKPRGCAGYMFVETERAGGHKRAMVQVRLGVPIREGDRYVALALLAGRTVSVAYVTEKRGFIARSIEVLGNEAFGDTDPTC